MARNHANGGRIYRAVITRTFPNDASRTFTETCGPYDLKHVAQAQITAAVRQGELSHNRYRDPAHAHSVKGHIESAEVIWLREVSA